MFSVRGYETDPSGIEIYRYGPNGPVAALGFRAAGGTMASPSVIPANSRIGLISSNAHDGTNYLNAARITFTLDGTVSTGSVPSMIQLSTTPVSGGHTERVRIDSAGRVAMGDINAGYTNYGAKLSVMSNTGTQASMFVWQSGVGSGQIGIPASSSTLRVVNTYADGTITNGKGIDINANGHVGVGWNPDNNWHLSVNSSGGAGAGAFLSTASNNIHAGLFENSNASFTNNLVRFQTYRANNSGFIYAAALSGMSGSADTDWYVRGDGQVFTDGSTSMSSPADYAEYFEWEDGNPDNEDRSGYSVSLVNGNKIKVAETGDTVIGIVSGNPAVIGDAAWNMWTGKYQKDLFNRYLRDENGDRILSEDFDPEAGYVSRENRPEWSPIGMVGKLRLRSGQLVDARWIKMRDISEDIEEWLVR
jgi:hypothetical protein